jgi:hypothetical protein
LVSRWAQQWFSRIQYFSADEVHPGTGDIVTGDRIVFSWPDKNRLPEGIFYHVRVFAVQPTQEIASGITSETSLALSIPPGYTGEMMWMVLLVDEVPNEVNHGQCNRIPANLLTVVDPDAITGIHFWYRLKNPRK